MTHSHRPSAHDLRSSSSAAIPTSVDPDTGAVLRPLAVSTRGAAIITGSSESALEKWRFYRDPNGPPFLRVNRSVRYLVSDLEAWLQAKREGGAQ